MNCVLQDQHPKHIFIDTYTKTKFPNCSVFSCPTFKQSQGQKCGCHKTKLIPRQVAEQVSINHYFTRDKGRNVSENIDKIWTTPEDFRDIF